MSCIVCDSRHRRGWLAWCMPPLVVVWGGMFACHMRLAGLMLLLLLQELGLVAAAVVAVCEGEVDWGKGMWL